MPDYMVVYKVVQVESMPILGRFMQLTIHRAISPWNLEREINEYGRRVDYTTYPRGTRMKAGMNTTSEPGYHALIKFDAAFDWYSSSSRNQTLVSTQNMSGGIASAEESRGFVFETKILKCGICKEWILGIGTEPGGELVVR